MNLEGLPILLAPGGAPFLRHLAEETAQRSSPSPAQVGLASSIDQTGPPW
jgi:hypothetical protein